jgi:hypothetical protein
MLVFLNSMFNFEHRTFMCTLASLGRLIEPGDPELSWQFVQKAINSAPKLLLYHSVQ